MTWHCSHFRQHDSCQLAHERLHLVVQINVIPMPNECPPGWDPGHKGDGGQILDDVWELDLAEYSWQRVRIQVSNSPSIHRRETLMSRFLEMSDKFQYIMNNLQTQQVKGSMPNDEKPMSFKKDKITEKPAACPDATPRFEIKEFSLAPGPFSARFAIPHSFTLLPNQ